MKHTSYRDKTLPPEKAFPERPATDKERKNYEELEERKSDMVNEGGKPEPEQTEVKP